jgi:hypothetical protein
MCHGGRFIETIMTIKKFLSLPKKLKLAQP